MQLRNWGADREKKKRFTRIFTDNIVCQLNLFVIASRLDYMYMGRCNATFHGLGWDIGHKTYNQYNYIDVSFTNIFMSLLNITEIV